MSDQINRSIALDKVYNIWELGGIINFKGKSVKRNTLIRSSEISSASPKDIQKLVQIYRLSEIIDLRMSKELEFRPDPIIGQVQYKHCSVFDHLIRGITYNKDTTDDEIKMLNTELQNLHRQIVTDEKYMRNIAQILRQIMEHDFSSGSVLWHCAEGKDRTGIISALILMVLNVNKEVIIEDYLETNRYCSELIYGGLISRGYNEILASKLTNVLLAKEGYLQVAMDAIMDKYSDIKYYMTDGLGIDEKICHDFYHKVMEDRDLGS